MDLGGGAAMVSGSLDVSEGGLYGGMWVGSGDTDSGNEFDLYFGYAGESGKFKYDLGYASYQYAKRDIGFNDSADVYLSLGYDALSFSVYSNVTVDDGPGYYYMALGYGFTDSLSASIGYNLDADDEESAYGKEGVEDENFAHVDITYAYNDNLSFTVSQMVLADDGVKSLEDQDTLVQLTYTLPVDM